MSEQAPVPTPPASITVAVTVFGDGRPPQIQSQLGDVMAICRILNAGHETLLAAAIHAAKQGPVQPVLLVPGGRVPNGVQSLRSPDA